MNDETKPIAIFYAYDLFEIDTYSNAVRRSIALEEMDAQLRAYLKHGHKFQSIDEAIEKIRNDLRESLTVNLLDQ